MKKKLLTTMLALVMSVSIATVLTACGEHEHSYSSDWSKDATNHWHACSSEDCVEKSDLSAHNFVIKYTADYSKEYTECSVCGYKTEEVEHTHTGGTATCTEKAVCSACSQEYGEIAHNYGELVAKVEPTTTSAGFEAHYYCDVCEKYFTTEKVETTATELTIASVVDRLAADGFTNVVNVTPETQEQLMKDKVLVGDTVYILKAGTYTNGLLINNTWNIGNEAKIAIYAEDGVEFTSGVQVLGIGAKVWVENINCAKGLIVSCGYKSVNVINNTVGSLVIGNSTGAESIVVEGNVIDGDGLTSGNDKYNLYISSGSGVLEVRNNVFKNSYSHAISLQSGNYDDIIIENNVFDSWGTNGETDRGAVKTWGEPTYSPNADNITDAMQELADEIISSNVFQNRVEGNACIVNVYGLVIND